MAAAHRETILTEKKAGGTSRYARKLAAFLSLLPFRFRSNLQFYTGSGPLLAIIFARFPRVSRA